MIGKTTRVQLLPKSATNPDLFCGGSTVVWREYGVGHMSGQDCHKAGTSRTHVIPWHNNQSCCGNERSRTGWLCMDEMRASDRVCWCGLRGRGHIGIQQSDSPPILLMVRHSFKHTGAGGGRNWQCKRTLRPAKVCDFMKIGNG